MSPATAAYYSLSLLFKDLNIKSGVFNLNFYFYFIENGTILVRNLHFLEVLKVIFSAVAHSCQISGQYSLCAF